MDVLANWKYYKIILSISLYLFNYYFTNNYSLVHLKIYYKSTL